VTRYRPTVAEIDLEAIRNNVRVLKPEGSELMAVVKADAYGHGDVRVSRAALDAGATWLGVALVEEGLHLRDAGIDAPVLVFSELPPGSEKEALAADLTPTLYTEAGLHALAEVAGAVGRSVAVHIKIDTGMHRVGLWPPGAAPAFARKVEAEGLTVEGLWTHFARSEESAEVTRAQLRRLVEAADAVRAAGVEPRYLHAANSAAVLLHPESHFDMVRTGGALYGIDPGGGMGPARGLRPVMTLRSAVTVVKRLPAGEPISYGGCYVLAREATMATVPIGYEDGYDRTLSNRADVLIGGKRRRLAGTVTMDHIMVDCGDDEVAPGDDVVLIGSQGDDRIGVEEIADIAGTIGDEIVTGISDRVPREFVG
jgi:alanine racemase